MSARRVGTIGACALAGLVSTGSLLAQFEGLQSPETPAPQVGQGAIEITTAPLRGLRAEVATLLVQGARAGFFPTVLSAYPEAAADRQPAQVPVVVEVPGAHLVQLFPDGGEAHLELYLYVIDPAGGVAAHMAQSLSLELDRLGETLFSQGLKFSATLALEPGAYSVRSLVFEPSSRSFSSEVVELQVGAVEPSDGSEVSVWAPPRFQPSCGQWIFALPPGVETDATRLPGRAVVTAGSRATISSRRLAPGGGVDSVAVLLRAKTPGSEIEAAERELLADLRSGPVAATQNHLEATWAVPADASGVYEMSLALTPQGGSAESAVEVTAPVEIWVLTSSERDSMADLADPNGSCEPSWAAVLRRAGDLGAVAAEPAEESVVDTTPTKSERVARRRARAAYRRVIAELAASGDLDAVASTLSAAEAELVTEGVGSFPALRVAELDVAQQVVDAEPEVLLPLLLLHVQAYDLHFEERRFGLATHSRELVTELAEVWLKSNPERVRLVADVLTLLADVAESRGVEVASQQLLESAVQLDPTHESALLLLAMSYERLGRYSRARDHLETLLVASSENLEARLRLAINLRRLGETVRSERILRRILRDSTSERQREMAYQTLTRLLFDQNRYSEAVAALETAVIELPGCQRLHILRTYALDRAGRGKEAAAVLATMPFEDQAGGESSRFLYTRPGQHVLAEMRQRLRQNVTVRLPLLGGSLQGVE